jgi:hypothetical protein
MTDEKPIEIYAETGHYGIDSRNSGRISKTYPELLEYLGLKPSEEIIVKMVDIQRLLDETTPDFFRNYKLKVKYGRPKEPLPHTITIYLKDQDGHIHDWISFSFTGKRLENVSIDYHHDLGMIHRADTPEHMKKLIKYEEAVGKVFSNAIGEEVVLVFPRTQKNSSW